MDKKTFRLAFTRLLTVVFILVTIASITSTAYATQNTVVSIKQANE